MKRYFYNEMRGKTVKDQWIDNDGAWLQFTDGSLLKVHNDELVDKKEDRRIIS